MRRLTRVTMAAAAGGALALGLVAGPALGAPPQVPVGQVLISDTQGIIWSYELATDELSRFADVTPNNFDIQYTGPRSLLIGNNSGFVSELDLGTFDETTLFGDLAGSRGLSVSPRGGGTYYIAEADAGAISVVAPNSTLPERLIEGLGQLENVAVDKQGIVYFSAGSELGRLDPSADPVVAEVVATLPDDVAQLNGFVLSPDGSTAYVTTSSGQGVYEVDLSTGAFTEAYSGPAPGGSAEDVALARNGDLYVVFTGPAGPPRGLYRIAAGTYTLEPLYLDDVDLFDPVDILLTPFQGF